MIQDLLKYLCPLMLLFTLSNCSIRQSDCESTKFYFPFSTASNPDIGLDTFVNTWYSSHLKSMGEPNLICESDCDVIRILYLSPFATSEIYRINKCQEEVMGYYKGTNEERGLEAGELVHEFQKKLSEQDWSNISSQFTKLKSTRISNETSAGTDGSEWVIERRVDSKYEYIDRWSLQIINRDKELFEYCMEIIDLVKQ